MRVTRGMFVDISLALADSQPVRGGIGSVVQSATTEPTLCCLRYRYDPSTSITDKLA